MVSYRAILIAGPTASGKSALAIRLARRYGGVVINADSMQVYRDLRILTARPDEAALRQVPHELYGHVEAEDAYSVGRWLADAEAAIARCRAHGRIPVVTGGTGLYFKALLEGLSPIPPVPDAVRAHWRAEARRLGPAALHALLVARDPDTARRLQPTDPQRLTRALEVLEATGRGLADWQREAGQGIIEQSQARCLLVCSTRADLHARSAARFDLMMAGGALEEARALAASGYRADLPVMRALGVGPLIAAARDEMDVAAAAARAKLDTRRYIKRQQTWFGRHMAAWERIDPECFGESL